jgi:hypothetical protein
MLCSSSYASAERRGAHSNARAEVRRYFSQWRDRTLSDRAGSREATMTQAKTLTNHVSARWYRSCGCSADLLQPGGRPVCLPRRLLLR